MPQAALLKALCTLPIRRANSDPHPKYTVFLSPKVNPIVRNSVCMVSCRKALRRQRECWQRAAKSLARKRVVLSTEPHLRWMIVSKVWRAAWNVWTCRSVFLNPHPRTCSLIFKRAEKREQPRPYGELNLQTLGVQNNTPTS